jgi:hypothetical protein
VQNYFQPTNSLFHRLVTGSNRNVRATSRSGLNSRCFDWQGGGEVLTESSSGGTRYVVFPLQIHRVIEHSATALFVRVWPPAALILSLGFTAAWTIFLAYLFVKFVLSLTSG